jgi:hypothetical protein
MIQIIGCTLSSRAVWAEAEIFGSRMRGISTDVEDRYNSYFRPLIYRAKCDLCDLWHHLPVFA